MRENRASHPTATALYERTKERTDGDANKPFMAFEKNVCARSGNVQHLEEEKEAQERGGRKGLLASGMGCERKRGEEANCGASGAE